MKSIKRGRGPSFMGGVGNIFACLFGIFWTFSAYSMGAPLPFCAFGVLFIGIAVVSAVYNFRNATGKNRYSEFDIVDHTEEEDPLNGFFGAAPSSADGGVKESRFCPYCGSPAADNFEFCNQCGRKLP